MRRICKGKDGACKRTVGKDGWCASHRPKPNIRLLPPPPPSNAVTCAFCVERPASGPPVEYCGRLYRACEWCVGPCG